jgi:serine/threonine-protein kinase SRPK3
MTDKSTATLLGKMGPLNQYRPGGHHPIHIGDQLSDRYTVFNKLGWCSASTVWLAIDHDNNDACVVVCVSKASAADVYAQELMSKMQHLKSRDNEHAGKKNLLFPHDSFTLSGPNGTHFCVVMTFEGQTVSRATNRAKGIKTRPLPFAQAKRAVLDLGNAVSYMHSLQMTHNGECEVQQ